MVCNVVALRGKGVHFLSPLLVFCSCVKGGLWYAFSFSASYAKTENVNETSRPALPLFKAGRVAACVFFGLKYNIENPGFNLC